MELSNTFVCLMGMGTVFVGLISIIILCKLMGLIFSIGEKKAAADTAKTDIPAQTVISNRGETVAAISAAIAEELGTDITGIRILSIKKI